MKKINILFALLITITSYSQFSVARLDGTPIVNGQTITVTGLSASQAEIKFKVRNLSTVNDINLKIKVEQIINGDGSDFQLCFGDLCFFSVTVGNSYPPNFPLTLAPGASNGNFDHFWNSNPGNGAPIEYLLKFYQLNDAGQEIGDSVTITYKYNPAVFSTNEFDTLKSLGVDIASNIVNSQLEFTSNDELLTAAVFDLNGRLISNNQFTTGANAIDFSSMSSAIYIVNFKTSQGKSGSIKVQKK